MVQYIILCCKQQAIDSMPAKPNHWQARQAPAVALQTVTPRLRATKKTVKTAKTTRMVETVETVEMGVTVTWLIGGLAGVRPP